LNNGGVREIFKTDRIFEHTLFTEEEMATIDMVVKKFKDIPTWDIVELSHKEKSWRELEVDRKLISYQDYAFDLQSV
jgi:hypothetical protein